MNIHKYYIFNGYNYNTMITKAATEAIIPTLPGKL